MIEQAAWSPDVDRLQKWTTVRNGTIFHCLVELDGPDFSLNETMHANSLSAIVQSEETLRNWLQSRGFTPGFGVIVEDSVQLRREFINLFTESALESLSRDKSDLLEYLITRNELDTHTLRCWQAADRLLDTAFVALLLPRTGACQDDAETEKILINGLKALATVFTQLVRGTLGKEIGTAVRKCTENLLSIVQLSVATGEDWLGPATRLWTLRTSISTSGKICPHPNDCHFLQLSSVSEYRVLGSTARVRLISWRLTFTAHTSLLGLVLEHLLILCQLIS